MASFKAWLEDSLDDARAALSDQAGKRRARRFCKGPLGALALVLIALAVYLPGLFTLPVVDRDEARFAQASRQMFEAAALPKDQQDPALHSGGLLIPYLGEEFRLNKPPLIYWLQSASTALCTSGDPTRDAIWMYRLPSVLGAIITVLATWRAGLRLMDPRAAWLGAAFLAVCPMIIWDAHQARADQVLVAFSTIAFWALAAFWTRARPRAHHAPRPAAVAPDPGTTPPTFLQSHLAGPWLSPLIFWAAISLAALTKGFTPKVVAQFALLTLMLVLWRFRWILKLRLVTGLLFSFALTLPWFLAAAFHIGPEHMLDILWKEVAQRSTSASEGHGGPPGYHTVLLPLLFWPGSLLTAWSIGRALTRAWPRASLPGATAFQAVPSAPGGTGLPPEPDTPHQPTPLPTPTKPSLFSRIKALLHRRPGHPTDLFLLAWIVIPWLFFELIATKLPHYPLPIYPAIALLTARHFLAAAAGALKEDNAGLLRYGVLIWTGLGIALAAAAPLIALVAGAPWWVTLTSLLPAALAVWLMLRALRHVTAGEPIPGQLTSLVAAVVIAANLVGWSIPSARALFTSDRVAQALRDANIPLTGPDAPVLASAGYHEPSLLWHTRARAHFIEVADAVTWAQSHRASILIAPVGTTADLSAANLTTTRLATIKTFNYAAGQTELLDLLRIE